MRIVKIIDKQMSPNEDGDYCIYAQLQVGNAYQYGVLLYETLDEARKAKKGEIVDIEKVRFSRRVNGVQL